LIEKAGQDSALAFSAGERILRAQNPTEELQVAARNSNRIA
jgi:hypothetical protein